MTTVSVSSDYFSVFRKSSESKYFYFIIPAAYFLIMLVVTISNRLIGDYGVETDFYAAYIPEAREVFNGNLIIDKFRGPVYQIVLALTGTFFKGEFFSAGKFLNVICASLSLYFSGRLIGNIFNKIGAFIVTLLISVNQVFWRYTYQPGTDMLFLAFYITALYFILKNDSYKNYFTGGVLAAAAYLTRYTGISLLIFTLLLFLLQTLQKYKITHSFKESIPVKSLLLFFIPVIIFISAWGIISLKKTGEFFYNMNYQNTALTVYKPDNLSKDEWNLKYQGEFKSTADVILKDPVKFVKKIFIQNLPSYFLKDMRSLLPKYLGILVILGFIVFIFKFKSQSTAEKFYFIASILFYLQILLIFYSERFSLPLLPFYCYLLVKLFSYNFLQKINFSLGKFRLFELIIFTLILFTFYNSFNISKAEINSGPVEILSIRDNVKNKNEAVMGKSVMARKPHIAYYLNMNFIVTPFSENYETFMSNVMNSNADYVFVSEEETAYLPDENLRNILLDYKSPPDDLEIITYTTDPVAILYKVKKIK